MLAHPHRHRSPAPQPRATFSKEVSLYYVGAARHSRLCFASTSFLYRRCFVVSSLCRGLPPPGLVCMSIAPATRHTHKLQTTQTHTHLMPWHVWCQCLGVKRCARFHSALNRIWQLGGNSYKCLFIPRLPDLTHCPRTSSYSYLRPVALKVNLGHRIAEFLENGQLYFTSSSHPTE